DRCAHYVHRLIRTFLATQDHFDPRHMPHPGHGSDHKQWNRCAEAIIAATDHLRGVANIRTTQVRKLERAGISTMTQLAATTATPSEVASWTAAAPRGTRGARGAKQAEPEPPVPNRPVRVAPGINPDVLVHLSTQARLQIESRG